MRKVEIDKTGPTSFDVPRAISRMTKVDFNQMKERLEKENNNNGVLMSSDWSHRMIMDDTNILPAMGHWVLHHSLEGRVQKLIELGSAIRKKNGLKGFNTETNSSSIKNQLITTKIPDLSNSGMVKTTTVHDIEPSSMNICEALGITKERTSELLGEVDKALQSSSLFSQAIEKVSKSCVHINELAYCSFMIGQSLWAGIQTKGRR